MVKTAAVRGAVSIESDEMAPFKEALRKLWASLQENNGFFWEEIISIQFTQTPDLKCANPAFILRQIFPQAGEVPLFCAAEAMTKGALPRMVRVLVTFQRDIPSGGHIKSTPVYLGKAAELRPDLSE